MTEAAKQQLPPRSEVPPQMQQFVDVAQHVEIVTAQVDLSPNVSVKLTATADSPQWAQKIQQIATTGVFFASAGIQTLKQQLTDEPPPDMTPEQLETVFRILDQIIEGAQPKLTGNTVEVALTAPEELNPILEEYLPQLIAAMEGEAVGSAGRAQSMNNLRQIGIAFHNYHDAHQSLPAQASYEGDRPLLSWRVHLLPMLNEQALYEQFNLEESWDSEHNRALIEQVPDVFASPGDESEPGRTRYLAVTGKGTAFEGAQGKKLTAFRDGTSNSIIVVEAAPDQAVPWTRPEDLDVGAEGALDALLSADEGFLVLLADGRVTAVGRSVDRQTLRNAFTIADGNPIDLD